MGNAITKEEFQAGSGSGSQSVGNPPIPCPPGSYGGTTGQTSSECSGKCSAGYYCTAGSTVRNQYPCPSGYYCLEGTGDPLSSNPPAPCAAGTSSFSGASSCTACESGKSSTPGSLCSPCTTGTYSRNACPPPPTVFTPQISPPGPQNMPPPGVQMWYDGNDVNGDGSPMPGIPVVNSWKDKSGFARHATTSGSPNITNFSQSSSTGSATAAMTFSRDRLVMAESSYGDTNLFSTALHMFVVVKETSNPGSEPSESTPISFGLGSIFDPFDDRRTFPGNSIDVRVNNAFNLRFQHNITIWEVLIYQASESTSYYREWFNGIPVTLDASATTTLTGFRPVNNGDKLFIANRVPSSTGAAPRGWNGYIYDIVLYNRALPTPDRQMVEGFLAWKWGIQAALPVQHPYQLVSPPITTLVSPPSKPFLLRTVVSSSGLVVNWLGGEGASSYMFTLNSPQNTYNISVTGSNIYTATINTIQPGAVYTLIVTAVNPIGSTPSDSVEATYFEIQVTTVAGAASAGSSAIDGVATQFIYNPPAVVSDSCGSLFVADANNYIRKIYIKQKGPATAAGSGSVTSSMVTTFAGNGSTGFLNTGSGTTSSFNRPNGLAIDGEDTIYVADTFNHSIRKISPQGVVTTLAGSGTAGIQNNSGTSSMFRFPMGLAVDYTGTVYVADTDNNVIRKITPTGAVTTFAGSLAIGSQDGLGASASFNGPCGVVVDSFGNVYVADTGNHVIRKITPAGAVTTVAGFAGSAGLVDGPGRCARFNAPISITIDSNGALYVCERFNNTIRKILLTPASSAATASAAATSGSGSGFSALSCSTTNSDTASVTTIAGNGTAGNTNGVGASSRFNTPSGLCFDPTGKMYVADTMNNTIRLVSILPVVTPEQPRSCITLCKPCCPGTTSTPGSSVCSPSASF